MGDQVRCEQLTRRGRPCRNPALPHSDPPRCARHRATASAGEMVTTQTQLFDLPAEQRRPAADSSPRPPAPPTHPAPSAAPPHRPDFAPEELDQLEMDGLSPDLRREVRTVRVVMLRLLRLWGDPAQTIPPEEARRLATLLFSGARTVAHLLSRPAKEGDGQDWLAQVLDELGGKYGVDL